MRMEYRIKDYDAGLQCCLRVTTGLLVHTSPLPLRTHGCGMQSFDRRLHLRRNRIRILHGQPGSGNWFTNTHLQWLTLDVVGVHRQQVECVDERDRHDISLRLDCEKECAWQE